MDGELVALDEHGRPSFQALQHRGEHPGHLIVFYAFDLLHFNGRDLRGEILDLRREQLQRFVPDEGRIKFSKELPGSAHSIVQAVRSAGLEGVIGKRRGSTYQPGENGPEAGCRSCIKRDIGMVHHWFEHDFSGFHSTGKRFTSPQSPVGTMPAFSIIRMMHFRGARVL